MVDLGFTAVKFDPAGPYTIRGGHMPAMRDISRSVAFCKAIREAVGDRADLLFGTHGQFSTSGAIRLAQALAPYDPLWFEEPVPPDNIPAMAEVARATSIPRRHRRAADDQGRVRRGAARRGAASILQPALGRSGGILETKKIAAIAEAHNALMAPHLYAGPIEWAANIQLAANIPNLLMAETIQTGGAFHLALIGHTITWDEGFIHAPNRTRAGDRGGRGARAGSSLHRRRTAPADAGGALATMLTRTVSWAVRRRNLASDRLTPIAR